MPIPFGRYQLHERIATGGMAELFRATTRLADGTEQVCVVKRVLPHLADKERFIRMFLDEAKVAAMLEHPGIVQVFDFGKQGDSYFLAMEYLAGEDVSAVLARSALLARAVPLAVAARVIADAAEALAYAHALVDGDGRPLELVHRDVTPSNLFITYGGVVKVLDFGIARARTMLHVTATGELKGKVAYMSPEQARGERVDRRSDVFSLGICLHELLTGRRLFQRDAPGESLAAVASSPIPPPSAWRDGVPRALDEIVLRALSRDPARRYPTAEALHAALRPFATATAGDLGTWLTDLFGAEHAAAKLGRSARLSPKAPRAPVTVTAAPPAARARSSGSRKYVIAAATGVLAALVVSALEHTLLMSRPPGEPRAEPVSSAAALAHPRQSPAAVTLEHEARPVDAPSAVEAPTIVDGGRTAADGATAR